jgi:protein-S-isoprenylcysteine O-methyltransferase Ste14
LATLETAHLAQKVAFYSLVVCWWLFGLTFWLRKRPPRVREAKRDWTFAIGLFLQSCGYFCVWFYPLKRRQFLSVAWGSETGEWALAALAIAIAIGSVVLVNTAARRLGKQWALAARVVEGHNLIQDGPYRFVRNPIYTGMFGMLLATGLVMGQWLLLLVGIVLFIAGTLIRVRTEERLLREAFGEEFENYARKVPSFIPGIY